MDFWNKFDIIQNKFKKRGSFKTLEFKIKQVNKNKALGLINSIIQNVKLNYFNKLIVPEKYNK